MAIFHEGEVKVASIVFLKPDGNPGRVDGTPTWENSAPDVCSHEVAADGMSAVITMLKEGTAQLVASGDADLGEGVRPVLIIGDVQVLPQEVTTGRMDFTDPVA
jgi:hypothetical protein